MLLIIFGMKTFVFTQVLCVFKQGK